MSNVIRVALPGYNALTDTDLDHFSLYTDEDNILIKEFTRGSDTIPLSGTPYEITHNLGYIPFFLVFVYDTNGSFYANVDANQWKLVSNVQSPVAVPRFYCYADTSKIYILNQDADTIFKWFIFYDNMVGASAIKKPLPNPVFAVAKAGKSAYSEDPNDFIFRSDLNTFKILKEGTATITYTADGRYTINHGLANYTSTSFVLFLKFPDGYTALIMGSGETISRDEAFEASDAYITATQIKFYLKRNSGSATNISAKYYIFETPLT